MKNKTIIITREQFIDMAADAVEEVFKEIHINKDIDMLCGIVATSAMSVLTKKLFDKPVHTRRGQRV